MASEENIKDIPKEGEDFEGVDISISNTDMDYSDAEIRVEKSQFSILHLNTLCNKRKDLILNPDFQRNHVWNSSQNSELIESILMGIPIPLMYFFEDKNGKRQVVDGRQRITAMLAYLKGEFALNSLKILRNLNGKRFSDLNLKTQGVYEDFQLGVYIIQPPTPERVKYDIFDRVNRGGTPLNKQEMRNALYHGRATNLLKQLSQSEPFQLATGASVSDRRMKEQYVILRSFAFMMLKKGMLSSSKFLNYKGDIDDFLARFMEYINNLQDSSKLEYAVLIYEEALQKSYEILGEDAFRFESETKNRRPINMNLLEALVYLFTFDFPIKDKPFFQSKIDEMKRTFDASSYFRGNTDSTTSVSYRFDTIDEFIKDMQYDK